MKKSHALLLAFGLSALGFVLWGGRKWPVSAQSTRPVSLIRLYTGTDGQTHSEERTVKLMANRDLSEVSDPEKASTVQFWRTSPGFTNDWHPAPARQYNIRLTGRVEVELGGGKKIRLDPGQIVLAEDVTGRGHITRCIGLEDCLSVLVPLDGKQ